MYTYVLCACMVAIEAKKKALYAPKTRVSDVWEPTCGFWDLNTGLLQEYLVLLTTEPSLLNPIAYLLI